MRLRGLVAGLIGLAFAALLLRLAIVRSAPESTWARQLWPEHPSVLTETAMREVGLAAAAGTTPTTATMEDVHQLARSAPLAADPYLVEGALADKQGALNRAEKLYLEARQLEPRSVAAHYLLTDLYLRTGRSADGIRELAELTRLLPASSVQIVPALAQFARSPGAADQLRQIFRSNPQLEQPVLAALAGDPANADLILSVASPSASNPGQGPPAWEGQLLDSMIAQGSYSQAYSVWTRLAGVRNGAAGLLFNPAFRRSDAPPPFNWAFLSAPTGVAEPENGSLRILFYGRDNTTLASQILLLPPGHYRLIVPVTVTSGSTGALAWSVICLKSKAPLLRLPLSGNATTQTFAGDFEIPAQDCDAQRIELDGTIEDSPETTDLRIGPLALQRTGA